MKLGFFTADQVCRLARITESQLRWWNKTNVFIPQVVRGAGPYRRIYTFRDVVGLRTISILRNKYNVDLDDLRQIERQMKAADTDWSSLRFYVGEDGHVYFIDPETGDPMAVHPIGQRPLFKIQAIARGIEKNLARMNRRTSRQIGKIDQHRHILQNSMVVAGTRIPTSAIYGFHKAGYSPEQIVKQYPRLTPDDVKAAVAFEKLKLKKAS